MKTKNGVYKLLFAVVLASALAGCAKDPLASLYVPTASDVTATATLAELTQGRTLYGDNCGACHSLYLPENFSASQWRSVLPGMTSRTGLSTADIALLTKYVTKGK